MIKPYYQDKYTTIYNDDCLQVLPELDKASAIVTDPPYELGFMGKSWDSKGVSFNKETWEIIRNSCKPGAMLLSFGGTRTFHRIACAIEDAGFEYRDTIMYVYGSGFPKSLNIHKQLQKSLLCGNMSIDEKISHSPTGNETEARTSERGKQASQYYLRLVPETNIPQTEFIKEEQGKVLQSGLSEQSLSQSRETTSHDRQRQSSMEGWYYIQASQRELQRCQVCQMSERISSNGTQGWLCNGTPFGYGTTSWSITPQDRNCPSYRPQSSKQQDRQPNAIPYEQGPQSLRRIIDLWLGYGTALKPAYEPIIVAMNPLDGTFANNTLKHGVAGLNIDECRVEYIGDTDPRTFGGKWKTDKAAHNVYEGGYKGIDQSVSPKGRFPANFIHDGSQMVMELFPNTKGGTGETKVYGEYYNDKRFNASKQVNRLSYSGDGSAARFFYCAKASKTERNRGCEELEESQYSYDGRNKPIENPYQRNNSVATNNHPTVKPLALMEYLVKLVKMPEYNLIIDPFMGSGTTLLACIRLGIPCIGIDNDEKSCEIASKRCEYELRI
jgi:DNA modification methylase